MRTVLLIDDEPFTIKMMDDLFRNNWRVINETIVEELPAKIREVHPDVILLNAGLRRTQGEEAFAAIRETASIAPIIVYCPATLLKLGRDMVRRGAFWCLAAPLNLQELEAIVNIAQQIEDHRRKTEEVKRDFIQLEEGMARMSAPLEDSFPIALTFEQDQLVQAIIELLADILQVEIVSLMLLDGATGELRIKAAKGLDPTVVRNTVKKLGQGIAGTVAKEGKPVWVREVDHDPQFAESPFYDQYSTKSLVCVPLKAGERVVGVLSANNKKSGTAFDEHDLYLVTIFSRLFVLTLQNAQLHYDREAILSQEASISVLNRKIGGTLEAKTLYHALLSECISIFHADGSLLFLRDEKEDQLLVYSLSGNRFAETRLAPSLFDYWRDSRCTQMPDQAMADPRGFRVLKGLLKDEVAGWMSALLQMDAVIGSLEVTTRSSRRFTTTDRAFLNSVARQAVLAINNARLYEKLLLSLQEIMEARKEVQRIRRQQYL